MKTNTVITRDGVEMSYFAFGKGERAFVILPGIGVKSVVSVAKAVENAYSGFADDYTVYVFDRRRNCPSAYSIREMAADTAAVMRELGIADADVFGASQGGMIAQYLAIDSPELVHAIVLGSSCAWCNDTIRATCEQWIALAEKRDITALTADFIDRLYSENTIRQYKEFLIHMNDNVCDADIDRFIILAKAIFSFDARADLAKVQCPSLVIGVENDLAVGTDASRKLAELLGGELYIYSSGYGHCVFDEAPDYKERLLGFFQRNR